MRTSYYLRKTAQVAKTPMVSMNRATFYLVSCVVVLSASWACAQEEDGFEVPPRQTAPPLATAKPLSPDRDVLNLAVASADGGWAFQNERLTIDLALQRALVDILKSYQTPWAAVVALDPATGRVLAMAEHSEADPSMRGLCTKAVFPAASIFKIVTGAALLESGVTPESVTCFHGGKRQVTSVLLEDSAQDQRCLTLAEAMGHSANVAFAKLTARYLDADHLMRAARAFHFNQPWPFPVPTDASLAAVPDTTIELAETGAGFGDVYLSPLHGAALAAVVANHGELRWPVLFEKDVGTLAPAQVLEPVVAQALSVMMATTVSEGTARRVFHERGHQVDAAGKTGSLADKRPVFRDYSWFVGFAPREQPRVAVAAIVVNDPYWRIRGAWLGREALRIALEHH